MSQVKPDNYFAVQGWMITDLNLKGNDLMIYAIIYGLSQYDGQSFTASIQYLVDWTNSSRRTVIYTLNSLQERGLIRKKESTFNGVKFCEYRAVAPGVQKMHEGGAKIAPNNKDNNTDKENHNPNGLCQKKGKQGFVPPTEEEVSEYILSKGYHVDPVAFVSYYEANGWYQGRTKMKSWKSAVVYWERTRKPTQEEQRKAKEEEDLKKYERWGKEFNDRKRLSETQEYNSEFL